MAIIGEAFVALRPLTTGFGTAAKAGIDAELGATGIFGGVTKQSKDTGGVVRKDFTDTGKSIGDSMDSAGSRISKTFTSLGTTLGNWGVPFAGSVGKIGNKIDEVDTKGKKFGQTLSTIGGGALAIGAVGLAAIAAESIHLASGLQSADAQIAAHENISVNAAGKIGKAFTDTAGTSIYSANEMAAAFAPVSGQLDQVNGHALTVNETLKFQKEADDLAEASGSNLAGTTSTLAKVMQTFQVPLSGANKLTNDLFNTSRITGVGVSALGGTIDKLKSRLGIAAPTVGDLSALLVDLGEHGVQGSRGLLVVNTAISQLLNSVPAVDAATAKAANSLSTKLAASGQTIANAQTAVTTAQTDGAAKVAAAQQRLVEAQERIAASTTAANPTVSQNISLQNAQAAVTNAQAAAAASVTAKQNALSEAQGKGATISATAAASTNAQVLAMQQLGLQVYNNSGKFVGMRDVIAQLQPKLEGMTQQQQLATLAQVFGKTANKSLLDTVLAGPAAYDKAQAAIERSTTAHKAAEKQAQTLSHQGALLKATLVDEGDKLGGFLIPKLEDLAKWVATDVKWFTQHKAVAESLAGVIGGVLTIAVATFTVNTGVKFVKSIGSAIDSLGKLGTKILTTTGIMKKSDEDTSTSADTTATETTKAQDKIAAGASSTAEDVTKANADMDTSTEEAATSIGESATAIQGSFDEITAGAFGAQEDVQLSFLGMASDVEAAQAKITASAVVIEADEDAIGNGSEVAAIKVGLANEEIAGSTAGADAALTGEAALAGGAGAKAGAGAAAAGAGEGAVLAGGAGAGAAGVGLSSILPALIAGVVSFQGTSFLLKHNVLDLGTGVTKLGNVVAGWFGKSSQDVAANERKKLLTPADYAYLAGKNPTAQGKKGGDAMGKSEVLTQLQQQLAYAKAVTGPNSAATKAAAASLYATENKWLPTLGKDTSLNSVNAKIYGTAIQLAALKTDQGKLAKDGTMAQSNTRLQQLKDQLKGQEKYHASETTLKDTKQEIKNVQGHIDSLKSLQGKIAKDQTAIEQAQKLKTAIGTTNTEITQLRQQIATTPPPHVKGNLAGTLKVTKG